MGSPYSFLSFRGLKIKNVTKIELFCLYSLFHFYDVSHTQTDTLKSGPETWELGPWNLRPRTPGSWDSGLWDPETLRPGSLGLWDPYTQDPGTGSLGDETLTPRTLEKGTWDLEIATLRSEILRAGPWELNLWQIPSILIRTKDWINFNWKANFDNEKVGHLSQTWLRCWSRWTKTFTKIFWHLT